MMPYGLAARPYWTFDKDATPENRGPLGSETIHHDRFESQGYTTQIDVNKNRAEIIHFEMEDVNVLPKC